jgi:hypothetical protein
MACLSAGTKANVIVAALQLRNAHVASLSKEVAQLQHVLPAASTPAFQHATAYLLLL